MDQVWLYLAKFEAYFGIFLLAAGVMLCFFGFRLIGPTSCLIGLLTCIAVSCLLFYLIFFSKSGSFKTFWYFLAGGIVLGIGAGILLLKFPKVGAGMAAGWGGFALGTLFDKLFLIELGYTWSGWATSIVGAAICVFLIFKFYGPVVITSTAALGAYLITRGFGCYLPGYYNELYIAQLIQAGDYSLINGAYWAYVIGFIVFAIAGGLVQRKHFLRKEARNKIRAIARR